MNCTPSSVLRITSWDGATNIDDEISQAFNGLERPPQIDELHSLKWIVNNELRRATDIDDEISQAFNGLERAPQIDELHSLKWIVNNDLRRSH